MDKKTHIFDRLLAIFMIFVIVFSQTNLRVFAEELFEEDETVSETVNEDETEDVLLEEDTTEMPEGVVSEDTETTDEEGDEDLPEEGFTELPEEVVSEETEITDEEGDEDLPEEGFTELPEEVVSEETETIEEEGNEDLPEEGDEDLSEKDDEDLPEEDVTETPEEVVPEDTETTDEEDEEDLPEDNSSDELEETTEETVDTVESNEAEDEPDTVSEEVIEYNKKTLIFNGSANGIDVEVKAYPGTFPIDTAMKVEAVSKEEVIDAVEAAMDTAIADLRAVDITFVDASGSEVQPVHSVVVNLYTDVFDTDSNLSVVHMNDEGEARVLKNANISDDNTEAAFGADHFSVYIVVDEEILDPDENAVATYEFYVGDDLKMTQYIKSGDSLADPGALAGDGANTVFKGWYVDEDQTIEGETPGAKLVFGEKANVPKTETIKIVAKVQTTYYITFLGEPDSDGGRGIVAVDTVIVEGEAGTAGELDISQRSVIPKSDTSAFEGWAETEDGTVLTETKITVTESTQLYAIVVDANWIHFDENVDWDTSDSDPTYTGPVYVKKTDDLSTKKPTDPTRPGYTFGGWYKDTDCTQAFTWSGTGLESDVTLYAKWDPDKANYTVIIWKQKVTDAKDAADDAKKYDFESSVQLEGTTGETLDPDDFTAYTAYNYTGFHYDRTEIDNPKKVRADGTTVVNVYYDRNLLTIRFVDGSHDVYEATTSNNGQQFGLVGEEYVQLTRENEGSYFNPDYHWYYQISNAYSGTTYRQATGNSGTQYGFVGGQMVELTRRNGNWYAGNNRYNGTRYFEGAQGNSGYGVVNGNLVGISRSDDGWVYTTNVEYTGTRYALGSEPDVTEYTGLYGSTLTSNDYTWPSDRAWYQNPNGGGTRLTFLDAFKFEGLSGVSEGNTVLTQYGTNNSGSNNIRFYKQNIDESWPSDATNTVTSSGGTFTITEKYEGFTAIQYRNGTGGWTDGGAGTSGISANNLQIRFQRNKYTLTFISDGETVGTKTGIPYEDDMSDYKIDDPTKQHYNFVGWCEDPEGVALFDWDSTMPAANKVLYAKWEPKQYHVSLDANGGKLVGTQDAEFNVPLDTILSKTSLFQNVEYDTKHELVGWFYKDGPKAGEVYDYGKIEEDVNLIAKWRMPGQVSIIYDAGEGGDGAPVDEYKYATDSSVVLGPPPTTINENYAFVGWKLTKGDGTVLYVNNTFDITEDLIEDYNETTKTGKITIVAVYNKTNEGPFEKTYIRWFKNDGNACFHVDTIASPAGDVADSTLLVNQMVDIQAAPTREGYIFLGWAKVDDTGDTIALEQDLDEDDLFIIYEGGVYKSASTHKTCTQVAADNDRKYEAMFAVWAKEVRAVITGSSKELAYNGSEQSNSDYSVTYYLGTEEVASLPDGVTFTLSPASPSAKGTDVGEYTVELSGELSSSKAIYIVPENAVTVDDTYKGIITLNITPKEVTITAQSKAFVYSGEAQSWPEYDVSGLVGSDAITATVEGSITFLSESPVANVVKSHEFTSGKASNYNVSYAEGELTMTNASVAITIKASDDEKTYDGTALTKNEVKVTSGSLLTGDELVAEANGSATNVADTATGNNPIADGYKIMHGDEDVTENYVITAQAGTLTIKKKAVTVTAKSEEFTYDGTAHSNSGYDVSGLVGSDAISAVVEGSITFPSESPVTNKVKSYEFTAGTAGNYDVTTADGQLTMKKASVAITITAADDVKTYDGTALTNDEVTVTSGSLLTGDELVAEATGSATNVADTATGNNPVAAGYKIMHGSEDVTENYVITAKAGTLTIKPKAVKITAEDKAFIYTGEAQSWPKYGVEGLVGSDAITAVVEGSITFPSESPVTNVVKSHEFTSGTEGNYSVSYVNGKLTMTNASVAITITAADDEKTYDGTKLTNSEVTVTEGELLEGDELVAEANGSATNVADTATGNNPIADGYKIMHGDEDVTDNYAITTQAGTLTINPKDVTVTAKSEEFTYDGTAHSNSGYDVVGLVGSDKITATVEGSITFPSESPVDNVVKSYEFTTGTAGNYSVTTADGKLTMKKASVAITITAADDDKTYDGTALTNDEVTVTSGSLLTGDELVAEATGSATNVADTSEGNNPIADGYKIMHGTEDVTENYVITTEAGTLTIDPKDVTISAQDKAFVYTGEAQSWPEYDVDGLVGDDEITATVEGSITFPSESPVTNEVKSYEFTTGTAGNYSVSTEDGELTMTNASVAITITAADDEKTYDGNALTNDEVTVTSGSLLTGDELVAAANGSATDVADTSEGNNPIADGYKIMHGTEDVTDNYVITTEAGTLTINPKDVTVTAKSEEFTYDGTAHSNSGYDVVGLVGSDAISAVVEGSITFPSESPVTNVVKSYEFTSGTAGNYSVTTANGKLTMKNASVAITITAADDEKTYDGTALTNDEVTVTSGTLLTGDELVAEATGSATNVADTTTGNNPIATGYKIMHGTEDVTASYVITTQSGTLTITARSVTLTSGSASKTYDAKPLTNDEVTEGGDGFVSGEGATYDVTGTQTLVGSSANTFDYTLNDGTLAANYSITKSEGTLKVTDGTGEDEEPVDPALVVNKESEDSDVALGETVTFTITATNIYEEAQTITLSEIEGVTIDKETFENVKGGESITATATYEITEADILNGSFKNTVTASMGNISKEAEAEVTTEEPNAHITVEKEVTSDPAEGDKYKAGETITYEITVINDGNLTISDVKVTDDLTGDEWTLDSLAPGESIVFETEYEVTEADASAGSVKNVATATGKDPEGKDPDVVPGETESKTEPEVVEYKFTKGDGQTWMKSSNKTADFEVTRNIHDELAFGLYLDIEIDGNMVDKSQYKYEEGCVELYISADYMETLAIGEHTIKAIFEDGEAEAKFLVAEEPAPTPPTPNTGDTTDIALWGAMEVASMLGLAGIKLFRKKDEDEE